MSLSGALTTALSGLQASTTAAQIISGNVSNAQTAGYTEKTVNLSQVVSGNEAGGVSVSGYTRASDTVLTATLNTATSSASYLSTQNNYMTQVQSVLDSSSTTPQLSSAVSNFQTAMASFANAPEEATQNKSVISAAQQLAAAVTTTAAQVSSLQTQVQTDLSSTVTTLNTDLAQVQSFNTQIATALANGQSAGDLQDQRDQMINSIAAITSVQVMPRANGSVALYTPGGTALVDGAAQTFSVSGSTVVNAVGADVTNVLTGGKLQAQTDFLSSSTTGGAGTGVIAKLQSQLENFANMFTSTAAGGFAATYDGATTGTGELASGFFTATTGSNGLPDLSTFAVNASLLNGTATVKQAASSNLSTLFTATNTAINTGTSPATTSSTFSSGGLTVSNQTYSGVINNILSGFQQAANTIKSQSTTAATQQTYYQNALSSETGVNTDTELVNLTNWQNSYAASAHVISTIQQMFTTLEGMLP